MQEKETNMTDINIYSGTPAARPHADVGGGIAERLKQLAARHQRIGWITKRGAAALGLGLDLDIVGVTTRVKFKL